MNFRDQIRHALQAGPPLLALATQEEDRALAALKAALDGEAYTVWNCLTGFSPETRDPIAALVHTRRLENRVVVFKDLHAHFQLPGVIRALRDLYYEGLASNKLVVLIGKLGEVPTDLSEELAVIQPKPPDGSELLAVLAGAHPTRALPVALHETVLLALRGLSVTQAGQVIRRVLASEGEFDEQRVLREIFAAKEALIGQLGYLQFVPPQGELSGVGGLGNLTDWIEKRSGLFCQTSVDAGLPIPRGILMMGVSGCGKSLVAKVVASTWKLPLFRLDMNVIYSGACGSPEAAFHTALQTIESVAPAVLWIDELENGLGSREGGGLDQSHLFSAFLTWMQEKPPLIFVAATANRIEMLPAEILRKGRFDQVFFCDLPAGQDREAIFRIHLQAQGASPEDFDLEHLVTATDGWTGAEIEEAVRAARIDAQVTDRAMTLRDIGRHIRTMVPLSETMSEQIKALRNWAFGRATLASSNKRR